MWDPTIRLRSLCEGGRLYEALSIIDIPELLLSLPSNYRLLSHNTYAFMKADFRDARFD